MPAHCAVFNGEIYVLKMASGVPPNPHAIFVYVMEDLSLKRHFHPFEKGLDQYVLGTWGSLAVSGDQLFVAERTTRHLTAYLANGDESGRYSLPGFSEEAAPFWTKQKLTEADRAQIRQRSHRFVSVLGTGDRLLLFDSNAEQNLFRLWIFEDESETFWHESGFAL